MCAVVSALFGRGQGPAIKPFIPIAGTVWLLADLLTAFLLLAQFYVNGRLSFAILSIGYGFSGLLTIPYLLAFPGLFANGPASLGDQQLSLVFWVTWHCCFPAIVMLSRVGAKTEVRLTSRDKIRTLTVVFFFVPGVVASALTALVFVDRAALPHLIVDGQFQALYREVCLPAIIAMNVVACAVLLARRERLSALGLMLFIAMFAAFIDATLNLSGTRFSYAWDVGKLITIFTASVVLLMFLTEIVDLYGRLEGAARIDALTLLPNRRALDEHVQLVFSHAQRSKSSVALLMIDIDLFKSFNDTFGHGAGDDCLRAVAATLTKFATRPLDLVGRFGGEEFLAVLPDTSLEGAQAVAEQMRDGVATLAVPSRVGVTRRVTISVGIGFSGNATKLDAPAIFEAADHALYEAKARGRNRVVVSGRGPDDGDEEAVVSGVGGGLDAGRELEPVAARPSTGSG
jgi:diguanylate cyclase (GGDEF)-like protein